jgi:hypothetical protein
MDELARKYVETYDKETNRRAYKLALDLEKDGEARKAVRSWASAWPWPARFPFG